MAGMKERLEQVRPVLYIIGVHLWREDKYPGSKTHLYPFQPIKRIARRSCKSLQSISNNRPEPVEYVSFMVSRCFNFAPLLHTRLPQPPTP